MRAMPVRFRFAVGPLLAAVAGALWFLWIGGWTIVSPFRIEPTMAGDWSTHVLGWLFFRNEPFAFPLGKIAGWIYPAGTTLGFTDSIPWLGLVHRLFSALLPPDFQYIGPWLLLCFAAQGAAGAWVIRSASGNPLHQALGGALLATVPTLRFRLGHPSLCAHALVLMLIHLHLLRGPEPARSRRTVLLALAVNVVAVGIHPYLAAMVAALTLALIVRFVLDRAFSWPTAALFAGAVSSLNVVSAYAFGYLGRPERRGLPGYGDYAADLLTFVNPGTLSRWLPPGRMWPMAYEGFAYFGVGGLCVVVLAAACLISRGRGVSWPWARVIPLIAAALALGAFAVSWQPRAWGHLLFDLQPLLRPLARTVAPFRSSGRFIWPLHYVVLAGALLIVLRTWSGRPRLASAVLAAVLILEVAENGSGPVSGFGPSLLVRYESPIWTRMKARYKHLAMFPAEVIDAGCDGRTGFRKGLVVSLSYLAYRQRLTFNSGYVARWSPLVGARCAAEIAEVTSGEIDPDTVYVLEPQDRPLFTRAGADCGTIDGLLVCVRPRGADTLAEYVRAHPG